MSTDKSPAELGQELAENLLAISKLKGEDKREAGFAAGKTAAQLNATGLNVNRIKTAFAAVDAFGEGESVLEGHTQGIIES